MGAYAGDMMGTNNKRNNGASALEKELYLYILLYKQAEEYATLNIGYETFKIF